MAKNISGIQQIGVGIPDVKKAWKWYRKNFGLDIPIFQESAEAALMTKYTGEKVHSRSAVLALNLQGGGGLEIWQYTSRKPEEVGYDIQLGDLGIFVAQVKTRNINDALIFFKSEGTQVISEINKDPAGNEHFFLKDPYGMIFQISKGDEWFGTGKHATGGISGCMIGVSDIEKSMALYSGILDYNKVVYDVTGNFEDLQALPGGHATFRRVLLKRTKANTGTFSELLGAGSIELIQITGVKPNKIFKNRYWGDQGFIHLCFDVQDMSSLKSECENKGFPFTVDSSNTFDMGEAAGHFSYIEDPDGTLIEFVETHKIPIVKKLGWYLNVKNRNTGKALPKWILNALSFSRVKD
ncbi:MAG: VOC family protein [Bacteroidetes bacterium]|nr:VOC family protein [Bacteroidota bacterium]HET6243422.1 VOC family protein [Bacteroidia bacterium]